MYNPEKLTAQCTTDEEKQKTQHNMCWTPIMDKQTQIL